MKIRLVIALVGLAMSIALPSFAQQKETPDPQLRQQLLALAKRFEEAWNNNDAAFRPTVPNIWWAQKQFKSSEAMLGVKQCR